MKTTRNFLLVGLFAFSFVTGLGTNAQAEIITAKISGTASGSLDGNPFELQPFEWVITYDTAVTYPGLDPGQSLFLNPVSSISLHDTHPAPINIAPEDLGLFVWYTDTLYVSPVRMSLGSYLGNIVDIVGTPPWDGITGPYLSSSATATFPTASALIPTDQGILTFSAESNGSSASVTATPEPSSLALLAAGGAALALLARSRSRRG